MVLDSLGIFLLLVIFHDFGYVDLHSADTKAQKIRVFFQFWAKILKIGPTADIS